MSTTISVPTTARVISGLQAYLPGFETRLNLEWDSREPYAIAFAFEQPGGAREVYRADREKLSEGATSAFASLGKPATEFKTWSAFGKTCILWPREEGGASVAIDQGVLSRFLFATCAACPLGSEEVNVDGLIAQILEETA